MGTERREKAAEKKNVLWDFHLIDRYVLYVFIAFAICIGFYVRATNVTSYLWFDGDEARDVLVAKHYVDFKEKTIVKPWTSSETITLENSPFYFFIVSFAYFFTRNIEGVTWFFVIIGGGAIVLSYYILRLITTKWITACGVLLASINPFLIKQSRSIWQPNINSFLSLLVILLLLLQTTKKRIQYGLIAIQIGFIGLHIHYSFFPFLIGVYATQCFFYLQHKAIYTRKVLFYFFTLSISNALIFAYATNIVKFLNKDTELIKADFHFQSMLQRIIQVVNNVVPIPNYFLLTQIILVFLFIFVCINLLRAYQNCNDPIAMVLLILTLSVFITQFYIFGSIHEHHLTPYIPLFLISLIYVGHLLKGEHIIVFGIICLALSVTCTYSLSEMRSQTNIFTNLNEISQQEKAAQVILDDAKQKKDFGLYVQTSMTDNFFYNAPVIWYQIEKITKYQYLTVNQNGIYNLFEPREKLSDTRYLVCIRQDQYDEMARDKRFDDCISNLEAWLRNQNVLYNTDAVRFLLRSDSLKIYKITLK